MEVGVREDVQPNLLLETLKIMNKKALSASLWKWGDASLRKNLLIL